MEALSVSILLLAGVGLYVAHQHAPADSPIPAPYRRGLVMSGELSLAGVILARHSIGAYVLAAGLLLGAGVGLLLLFGDDCQSPF